MVIKAQLFSKVSGQTCIGAVFKGFHAPKNARTFDRVTGIGKKGEFDIVTFRNSDGQILKRVSRFIEDAKNEILKLKNWSYTTGDIHEVTAYNGVVKEHTTKTFLGYGEEILLFEQRLVNTDSGIRDYHKCARYSHGEKTRIISYETKWDGQAPKVSYQNINGKLPDEGLEYLPLCVSPSAIPRYFHVAKAQRKYYGLEGVIPEMKLVQFGEINHENACAETIVPAVTNPSTGQILYAKNFVSNTDIIRSIAHEHKHADDFSKMIRLKYNADVFLEAEKSGGYVNTELLEKLKQQPMLYQMCKDMLNFYRKSIEKGIITKQNSKGFEYWHYKYLDRQFNGKKYQKSTRTLETHDMHPLEIGPIAKGNKEAEKFGFLMQQLLKLLTS